MPKGPKGQKRPADVIGAAAAVRDVLLLLLEGARLTRIKHRIANIGQDRGGVAIS